MDKELETKERLKYACEMLNKEAIPHTIKNEKIGQINLYFNNKTVMSFWARTGRIVFTIVPTKVKQIDPDEGRGLKRLINLYKKEFKNIEEKKKLKCSNCGKEIEDNCYKCLDNFIQTKYFDSEEENSFCCKDCFCEYVQLEECQEDEED